MSALDKLLAATNREPKRVEIDLGGDNIIEIYFTPMTLGELQKIQRHAKGDEIETLLYTLIFKAKDAKNDQLFTIADKMQLKTSVSSDILATIVSKMNDDEAELAEK